jgi:hypothetical protein
LGCCEASKSAGEREEGRERKQRFKQDLVKQEKVTSRLWWSCKQIAIVRLDVVTKVD